MKRTWVFKKAPLICAAAAVGGKSEAAGPLARYFDCFFLDDVTASVSYEEAEGRFLARAAQTALNKSTLSASELDLFLSGDLMNQLTSSTFAAQQLDAPYFGVFAACATVCEAVAIGALAIDAGQSRNVLIGSASHSKSVERQFRFPNEYGVQKPPTSQKTATAAGAMLLSGSGSGIEIESVTVGRVVDYGVVDPLNMGAAMAPAAADTLATHLRNTQTSAADYDFIVSGDLGRVGRALLLELLSADGFACETRRHLDCGLLLYGDSKEAFAGGSGAGCIASVLAGYLSSLLKEGAAGRILLAGTGALLSPNWVKQGKSIPCISHVISLRAGERS